MYIITSCSFLKSPDFKICRYNNSDFKVSIKKENKILLKLEYTNDIVISLEICSVLIELIIIISETENYDEF